MPEIQAPNPPVEASWKHPARKARHSGAFDHDVERLVGAGGYLATAATND